MASTTRSKEAASYYESLTTLSVKTPAPHVLEVSLNRAEKMNAMNKTFFKEIGQLFGYIASDTSVRAVILSGTGKHFSSGLDLEDFKSLLGGTDKDEKTDVARHSFAMMDMVASMQQSFSSIDRCSKPVIAAIQGACIGGGVDLVLAADIRMCTSDAWFCVKEVDIGIAADLGTLQRMPKAIGSSSLVRELIYTARKLPAEEAKSCGLVSSVSSDATALREAALNMATTIASKSPVAVQGSKLNLNYSREHTTDAALDFQVLWSSVMLQTNDISAAVKATMKRVPPTFSNL